MGWIFAGFITIILLETLIRVLENYEPIKEQRHKPRRC